MPCAALLLPAATHAAMRVVSVAKDMLKTGDGNWTCDAEERKSGDNRVLW